jgi:anti-sigma factor RsiW
MTIRFPSSLLEDYVDNELSEEERAEFKKTLESSPELRDEYQSDVQLKELLSKQTAPDPGEDYWSETTQLILARTSGSDKLERTEVVSRDELSRKRSAFYRSLVSAAAALFILFSALYVGSGRHHQMFTENISAGSVLITASVADEINSEAFVMMTKSERNNATVGMMILGPPCPLGRFTALPMLLNGR